jgi:hypothetical protein
MLTWKIMSCGVLLLAGLWQPAAAQYPGWQHAGPIYLLTTPEGADLPATAAEAGFPVLVRLHRDFFPFQQTQPQGGDLRFSAGGNALAYQIEEWDAANGTASVWVRLPQLKGNARQAITVHWGKADAASESNGAAVFNESNGYASVWHMTEPVRDEVGTITSKDEGTTAIGGVVGQARHFAGKQGITGGDNITGYPSGTGPMTTEAWFRAEGAHGTVLAWGKEQRPGKVMVNFLSPPRLAIQCYFADVEAKRPLAVGEWYHVVHTYQEKDSRVYINGRLEGASTPVLNIPKISSLWIGGWYRNYNFVGAVDEVRISKVVRSADWVKLQYENQQPLQTLVGPVVQAGSELAVSPAALTVAEGKCATVSAKAGGAQKIYWILKRDGRETVVATDRFTYTFDAGRVTGETTATLQFKAIYPNEVRTKEIPITINEGIPDPAFTVQAPAAWDGRTTIEVVPQVTNLAAMQAGGAGDLKLAWTVSNIAVDKEAAPGKLILRLAQNSGNLTVAVTADNGGVPVTKTVTVAVSEPKRDAWLARTPAADEQPVDNQFYSRDDRNEGTLYYNGTLTEAADAVFLKVYADDKPYRDERGKPAADLSYALAVKLKPGLVKYKVEFGTVRGGSETVVRTVTNLVCGDAYLIDGQSNALATDTGEQSPPETSEWIRSYGRPEGKVPNETGNLWCNPVWKARKGEAAELGYWGMELAKRLVASQQVPIFIINGAAGGTRIDQHQRNAADPTDLTTIYGRMLWRVRQAKLTHGIRAILWHQGENNQGAASPTGDYDWKSYQEYFIEMSAAWKRDFPNVQHYYVFQIWPNACSMAGNSGAGDHIREIQRTLPRLYSNLSVMSTLGIKPPGGCHYPLEGWAEFARLIQPLIERDVYGKVVPEAITPPDLKRACFTSAAKDAIALEFDQPVIWIESLASQFYLDGIKDQVASGTVNGMTLTLKLKAASAAGKITYLKETAWDPNNLLYGTTGIAALTFCEVPIQDR